MSIGKTQKEGPPRWSKGKPLGNQAPWVEHGKTKGEPSFQSKIRRIYSALKRENFCWRYDIYVPVKSKYEKWRYLNAYPILHALCSTLKLVGPSDRKPLVTLRILSFRVYLEMDHMPREVRYAKSKLCRLSSGY